MLAGAGAAIGGGAQTGDPLGLALGVVLAPVFAVGGGVYGAAAAHSTEETEGAIAAIDAVYDDSALLGSIDEKVEAAFEAEGFSVVRECGARALIEASVSSADQEAIAAPDCDLTNVKSRLRLEESFAFTTHGAYSPDLIFAINVDAMASSSDPSKEAMEFRWVYISPKIDFFDATSSSATDLRQHIAAAQARLARRIVEDLHTARHEIRVTGTYWPDRAA